MVEIARCELERKVKLLIVILKGIFYYKTDYESLYLVMYREQTLKNIDFMSFLSSWYSHSTALQCFFIRSYWPRSVCISLLTRYLRFVAKRTGCRNACIFKESMSFLSHTGINMFACVFRCKAAIIYRFVLVLKCWEL